jgi:hypothetical protein
VEKRVPIVVVTVDQLHPAVLDTLIPVSLARRPIDTQGPYFKALVQLYSEYAEEARKWIASRSAP